MQREQFLQRCPQLRGKRLLLILGRIHPKKGVDLLIEAFAAVARQEPTLQLVLAGPDQLGWQDALQQRAAALGICDRLTWLGMLSGELMWSAFRCAELFYLPSYQENFGIVLAEGLACGLLVAIAEPVNISAEVAIAVSSSGWRCQQSSRRRWGSGRSSSSVSSLILRRWLAICCLCWTQH